MIGLHDVAPATPGDPRNVFEDGGKRFPHTVSLLRGRPVVRRLASLAALADNAMHAGAMATALMALDPEARFAPAEKERMAARFIVNTDDGFIERNTGTFPDRHG